MLRGTLSTQSRGLKPTSSLNPSLSVSNRLSSSHFSLFKVLPLCFLTLLLLWFFDNSFVFDFLGPHFNYQRIILQTKFFSQGSSNQLHSAFWACSTTTKQSRWMWLIDLIPNVIPVQLPVVAFLIFTSHLHNLLLKTFTCKAKACMLVDMHTTAF